MIFCLLLDRLSVNYLRPGIVLGSSRVGGSVRQCGSVRRLPRHISHLVRSKFKGHRCYGCENCEAAEMFFAITSSHIAWFTSNKDQNVPRRSLYRQLHFGCWKFKDHGTGRENAKTVFLTVAPPEVARFTLGKDQNVRRRPSIAPPPQFGQDKAKPQGQGRENAEIVFFGRSSIRFRLLRVQVTICFGCCYRFLLPRCRWVIITSTNSFKLWLTAYIQAV